MSLSEKFIENNKRQEEYYIGDKFPSSLDLGDAITAVEIAKLEGKIEALKEMVIPNTGAFFLSELKQFESQLNELKSKHGL